MKAIILAAGDGTHLSPFSDTRPISMIGVAGRTLLDNTFGLLKSAGVNDIFVVTGHKKEKLIEQIPLARLGLPEDVARCVNFLVSDKSSYITGQVINLNGGMLM